MKAGLALGLVLGATVTSVSRADTPLTVWDMAKNPKTYEEAKVHANVAPNIELYSFLKGVPRAAAIRESTQSLDNVRMFLDEAGATKPGAVLGTWLQYDLGWMLDHQGQYDAAIPVLQGVAHELGMAAFSQEVWEQLADAFVHTERTPDEIHAYDEVLARATMDGERVTPLLNQGEAFLRSGDADSAIPQFREVLRLTATIPNANDIDMLAEWDLAVALDRSGDPVAGIEGARSAVRMDRRCVAVVGHAKVFLSQPDARVDFYVVPPGLFSISEENPQVFFVPEYEREWYLALGYEALALEEPNPSASAKDLWHARGHMTSYVNQATEHGGDKWLDLGRKRLDTIVKREAEAQKRAGTPSH